KPHVRAIDGDPELLFPGGPTVSRPDDLTVTIHRPAERGSDKPNVVVPCRGWGAGRLPGQDVLRRQLIFGTSVADPLLDEGDVLLGNRREPEGHAGHAGAWRWILQIVTEWSLSLERLDEIGSGSVPDYDHIEIEDLLGDELVAGQPPPECP